MVSNRIWTDPQMHQVTKSFLSKDEISDLSLLADLKFLKWTSGRQHTGYLKLPLQDILPRQIKSLAERSLSILEHDGSSNWDMYLIKYPVDSMIPRHTDPVEHGKRHRRLNAVVKQAIMGGQLTINGQLVQLDVSDAVAFSPDLQPHEVSKILAGERVLFSVGVLLDDAS